MAKSTYYVVQPIGVGKRGFYPLSAIPARDADHAQSLAKRVAERVPGVVAFSQTAEPELGEYDPPTVLCTIGMVPPEALEAA